MNTRVGVIGAGRMGSAMVRRLLAQGFSVTVCNRSASPLDALKSAGAIVAATPRDLAIQCDVLISSLTDESALLAACSGPDGLLTGKAGMQHLSTSTLSPEAAGRIHALHGQHGMSYLSCPVQGRPVMAEAGQLIAWVSGEGLGDAAQAALAALARKTILLGLDVKHAPAAKLALNMLMNANIELFAEAFHYSKERGLDLRIFAEALTETAFAAPLFKAIVGGLLSGDDAAKGSDISVSSKDLGLLVQDMPGLGLPVATALHQVFREAEDRGWGSLEPTVVRRLFSPSSRRLD